MYCERYMDPRITYKWNCIVLVRQLRLIIRSSRVERRRFSNRKPRRLKIRTSREQRRRTSNRVINKGDGQKFENWKEKIKVSTFEC